MARKSDDIIVSLNLPTMIDLAWDEAFGSKVHPHIRAVLDMCLYCMINEAPTMTNLIELVSIAINRDTQTGKKAVQRAVDLGYLNAVKDKNDKRKKLICFAPEADESFQYLNELKRCILKVIDEQLANPENPIAGKGLVPDSIYTNVEHK